MTALKHHASLLPNISLTVNLNYLFPGCSPWVCQLAYILLGIVSHDSKVLLPYSQLL